MNSGTPSVRERICLDDDVEECLIVSDAANDTGTIARAKAAQGQRRHMRLIDPARLETPAGA